MIRGRRGRGESEDGPPPSRKRRRSMPNVIPLPCSRLLLSFRPSSMTSPPFIHLDFWVKVSVHVGVSPSLPTGLSVCRRTNTHGHAGKRTQLSSPDVLLTPPAQALKMNRGGLQPGSPWRTLRSGEEGVFGLSSICSLTHPSCPDGRGQAVRLYNNSLLERTDWGTGRQ